MSWDSFEDLRELVLSDDVARSAALENNLRRKIASHLQKEMKEKSLSFRTLAKLMKTSTSQLQRLVKNDEFSSSVTLKTLCRAAIALDQELGKERTKGC